MAESSNLEKLEGILSTFADLIREGEGHSKLVAVSDMRQKIAAIDIAKFAINNGTLTGHTVVNGTTDSSVPADTLDYFRKLLTNFANKVRVGSEKLDIDDIELQENQVCGVHRVNNNYGLRLPSGVTNIGASAFRGCSSLTSITIPDSVTSIGNYAFYSCGGLINATIGSSVTSIGNNAFSHCSGLTSITIPDNVTSIGGWAFEDCSGLTSITIPDNVTSIGDRAFSSCSSLTSITIPDNVASIGQHAFQGCSGLTSITVSSGNTVYHSNGNCLINTADKKLILGCKNSIIPSDGSVMSIDSFAFYNCSGLTGITIPDSITSIGDAAFAGCSGLTNIVIPDSVTSLGSNVFSSCTGLTSITIPDSVTGIRDFAFYNCIGLTSITIPDSITKIGSNAFFGCSFSNDNVTIYYNGYLDNLQQDTTYIENVIQPIYNDWNDLSVTFIDINDVEQSIPLADLCGGGGGSGSGSGSGSGNGEDESIFE